MHLLQKINGCHRIRTRTNTSKEMEIRKFVVRIYTVIELEDWSWDGPRHDLGAQC